MESGVKINSDGVVRNVRLEFFKRLERGLFRYVAIQVKRATVLGAVQSRLGGRHRILPVRAFHIYRCKFPLWFLYHQNIKGCLHIPDHHQV